MAEAVETAAPVSVQVEKLLAVVAERAQARIANMGRSALEEVNIISTTQIELERLRFELFVAAQADVRRVMVEWYEKRPAELRPEETS